MLPFAVSVERFDGVVSLVSLYLLLFFLLLTIPLSLLNLCIEFLNTYKVVKRWWKGPPAIYVLSLVIGKFFQFFCYYFDDIVFIIIVVLASLSAAVSSDFYVVDLSDPHNIHEMINSSLPSADLYRYQGAASLQYSAFVFYVGKSCTIFIAFSDTY